MHNILVTGGSRGLGLGIIGRLVGEGYHAVAVARRMSDPLAGMMEQVERRVSDYRKESGADVQVRRVEP